MGSLSLSLSIAISSIEWGTERYFKWPKQCQRIGLRENLQETMVVPMKYRVQKRFHLHFENPTGHRPELFHALVQKAMPS